jgi:BirA family biotin operon repressor/biotin-[acetyl-CoA-carboxylase] ligase
MGPGAFDPDRFRELLAGPAGGPARPVLVFDTLDSTSSELRRRLDEGAPVGTAVVAGSQTAGRGRVGRGWCSPPGGNLYLSVAVAVPPPETDNLTALPLAAGVAAVDALVAAGLEGVRLKWPNDLMADGRKLGGLLCEASDPRGRFLRVLVGIGVNLSAAPLDGDLGASAITAPRAFGRAPRAEPVAAAFISGLERRLADLASGGRAGLVAGWRSRAEPFGRRVRAGGVEGVTVDLDAEGRLLVRRDDGAIIPVAGGIVEGIAS